MINSTHFTSSQTSLKQPSDLQPRDQLSVSGRENADTNTLNSRSSDQNSVQLSDEAKALAETKAALEVDLTAAQQRSQASADVIIGFINQHLDQLKADGASEQEIAQALSDGFEGFVDGFQEAMQILNNSGLLNDELSAELSDTQARVSSGLEQLRQQYSPSSELVFDYSFVEEPETNLKTVSGYQNVSYSNLSSVSQASPNNGSIQSQFAAFAESYQQQQLANLEVLTRDGDKVSIRYEAFESYDRSASYTEERDIDQASLSAAYFAQNQSGFGFAVSVEGDLDEGELEALDKLFRQVDSLAQEFFEGDFDRAFAMAMELQIDSSELASMSLDIQQSSSYSVAEAYGSVQKMDSPSASEARPIGMSELGSYVQGIIDALEMADMFDDPIKLLSDLFANHLAQQSLLFPENSYNGKAQQLDALMPQPNEEFDV